MLIITLMAMFLVTGVAQLQESVSEMTIDDKVMSFFFQMNGFLYNCIVPFLYAWTVSLVSFVSTNKQSQ